MKTGKFEHNRTIQKSLENIVALLDDTLVVEKDGKELTEDERSDCALRIAEECRIRVNEVNKLIDDATWLIDEEIPDDARWFLIKAGKIIGEVIDEDVSE